VSGVSGRGTSRLPEEEGYSKGIENSRNIKSLSDKRYGVKAIIDKTTR
jgi:hypothetical protein